MVYSAFSNDWTSFVTTFDVAISIVGMTASASETPSAALCNLVFPAAMQAQFGSSYTCFLDATTLTKITVALGNGATLNVGSTVTLNAGVIKKVGCSTAFASFLSNNLTAGGSPAAV